MNEELSTQFPSPPEIHTPPPTRPKHWQIISYFLIISGAGLITWGGWQMIRHFLEINNPPARILEVSQDRLEPTATATTLPTPTLESVTPTQPVDVVAAAVVAESSPLLTPTATVSPTEEPTRVPSEQVPPPAIEPTAVPPEPTVPAVVETAAEAETDTPSMTENPLPVVAEEAAVDPQPEDSPANIDNAIPAALARIVAESITLDSPIVDVGWRTIMFSGSPVNVWTVADFAAGWHSNSTLPGQGGNIVLSGHHNINGEVFRYIVDLEPGDTVTLYDVNDTAFQYIIEDKFIVKDKDEPDAVRLENAKWIGQFNEERLTLITCWPYTNNTHRVIVIAKPVTQ